MRRRKRSLIPVVLTTAVLLLIAACGGGGGGASGGPAAGGGPTGNAGPDAASRTLSGVAAAGAPLVGYVYVKDSGSPPTVKGPIPIAPDGSYSVDVTGMTPPFYIQAVGSVGGQGYRLFSVATGAGVTNVNPLTTVAVAAAGGTNDPELVYDDPGRHPVTAESMANAVAGIQALIEPLLDACGATTTDFLNGRYAANGTGIDQVFDITTVDLDTSTGTVTFVDKTGSNNTIGTTQTTTLSGTVSVATGTSETVSGLQGIKAQVEALADQMMKGSSATYADLAPFFAANFGVDDGRTRAEEIYVYLDWLRSNIPNGATLIGDPNVSLVQKGGDGSYTVGVTIPLSDGTVFSTNPDGDDSFIFVDETGSGLWKLAGNGRHLSFSRNRFGAVSYLFMLPDGTTQSVTGLALNAVGYGRRQTAVVEGPGLPAGGVLLATVQAMGLFEGDMAVATTGSQGPYAIPGCTFPACPDTDIYALSDTAILAIPDNAAYTYKFYDGAGALIETRTMLLPKRPLLSTEVASAVPTLGGLPSHAIGSANIGGTLDFTYVPAPFIDFPAVELHAGIQLWDDGVNSTDLVASTYILPMNQGSSGINVQKQSWTETKARLDLSARDVYHREVHVQWLFE